MKTNVRRCRTVVGLEIKIDQLKNVIVDNEYIKTKAHYVLIVTDAF